MYHVGGDLFWKSSARLADGREIVYYDESPGLGRAAVPDRRPLAHLADPGPPGGPLETAGVPGRPATGRCEVVCFTSDHNASFASLSPRRVRTVLEAWADRTAVLQG